MVSACFVMQKSGIESLGLSYKKSILKPILVFGISLGFVYSIFLGRNFQFLTEVMIPCTEVLSVPRLYHSLLCTILARLERFSRIVCPPE